MSYTRTRFARARLDLDCRFRRCVPPSDAVAPAQAGHSHL